MHKLLVGALAALALGSAALAQGVNPPVATNVPPPSTNSNSSLYHGSWELFAGGSYQMAKATTANSQTLNTSNVAGAQLGLRFHASDWNAAEVRIAWAEPTQLYGPTISVKSRDLEFELDYVMTVPTDGPVRPFLLGGGSVISYSPTGGNNTPGAMSQKKFAFNYGGGFDFAISPHLGLRLEYRGLVYRVPDFGLIGIGKWNHMPEPDIGLVWHF